MEKVIQNIPLVLLVGIVARTLIFGAQIPDSLAIIAISGLIYLTGNLKYNKEAIKVQQEISALRSELAKYEAEIKDTKQYVSGVKMSQILGGKRG